MKTSAIRLAIAAWIAPAGTVVVPPVRSIPMPRPDIASTPRRPLRNGTGVIILKVEPVIENKLWLYIYRCPDPSMWYADKIDQYVPYEGTWPEGYRSRDSGGYINIVKFDDASITTRVPQ